MTNKIIITVSILLIVWAACSHAASSPDCSFEDVQQLYNPNKAKQDAHSVFKKSGVRFYGVANGYGPSRPGLENVEMSRCFMLDTQWEMLWVGADSAICKSHDVLQERAIEYAKYFNMEMLTLAQNDTNYKCSLSNENAN